MNTDYIIDWNRIAARYLAIATFGSAIIVAGTYFLHQHNVNIRLDKEAVLASLSTSKGAVADLFQNYVIPEGLSSGSPTTGGKPPAHPPTAGQASNGTPPPATGGGTPVPPPVATTGAQRWAVVRTADTKAYNRSGKYLRAIPAGTLVDVVDIKSTSAGELAICKIIYEGREIPDIVIKTGDLDIQSGSLGAANPRERDLRVQYVRLLQSIVEREAQLTEAAKGRNPHYAKYKEAQTAYSNMRSRTQELIKKRDTAQGSDRMEIYDQLRIMKGESIAVKQTYEAAKQKYDEWNASNAQKSIPPDDAQLAGLRGQLRGVEDELRHFPKR